MSGASNKIIAAKTGWRTQFRYRGLRHQSRVPELDVRPPPTNVAWLDKN